MARSCEDLRGKEDDPKNPFLFSNFVKNDTVSGKSAKVWNNFDSSNESIDHAPFPQLCDGPSKKKEKGKKIKNKNKRRILKIIDDDIQRVDEEDSDTLHDIQKERRKITSRDSLSISGSENEDKDCSEDSESDGSSPLGAAYILPMNGSDDDIIQLKIQELEAENEMLKQKLLQAEGNAISEKEKNKQRIENLVEEVKIAKKKEMEETAALESVVHMVEENLRLTTQRALKAEATVAKLKDEIKFMKEDSIPRAKYTQLVEEYEYGMESVRQKSRDTAKLMRVASNKTEPLIKELLSGVSSLRFFAEQFENIDRIAEIDPTRDRVV